MRLQIFASCAPGLESLLSDEVRGLLPADAAATQPTDIEVTAGGVSFSGDLTTLGHALVGLGLAARVLLRLEAFSVRHLNELEAKISAMDWRAWLSTTHPFRVRSTSKKSKLYHTGAIDQRVLRGVSRVLGMRQPVSAPTDSAAPDLDRSPDGEEMGVVGSAAETPEIVIRIERDHCVVSLDVSGTPLHRRGYRRYPFRAPLREDLARALVIVSGWKGQLPLWDPFCGSGTVLIEAALWIAAYPPGLLRSFALEQTRLADPPTLQQIKADRWSWRDRLRPGVTAATDVADWRLVGVDVDGQAIAAAQQNWAAWPWEWLPRDPADSADRLPPLSARRPTVEWVVSDIRHLPLPASPIAVVTNPPWGGRIGGGRDLLPLYQRLGAWRKQSGPQGKLALVAHQRELAYRTGVPLHSAFLTDAGGIKINALIESDPQVQ